MFDRCWFRGLLLDIASKAWWWQLSDTQTDAAVLTSFQNTKLGTRSLKDKQQKYEKGFLIPNCSVAAFQSC